VLQELKNRGATSVNVGTVDQIFPGVDFSAPTTTISDFLLTFVAQNATQVIPLCFLVGVQSAALTAGFPLTPPNPAIESSGECNCCERPLRVRLSSIPMNTTIVALTTDGGTFGQVTGTIAGVGMGIVIINPPGVGGAPTALSICQITGIQINNT
jgi:hypothetical protein